jgi:serine/threonine protein kinase/tetratricopeptide (TPR) repeat protein
MPIASEQAPMSEPQDRCPTPDQLSRLLAGELLDREGAEVTHHVEHCASCQRTLEHLTDDSGFFPAGPAGESPPPALVAEFLDAAGARVGERLRQDRPPPAQDHTSSDAEQDSAVQPPPSAPPHPVVETVGSMVGPYKLLQLLGEGGMGAVWVAEQQQPVKRRVALKVIKPGMDSAKIVHRFEAERQALALMDHPNIAKVFDGGTTSNGRPYFVMELVPGVPITQYCDELNLSIRERLELCLGVCRAVQHAHQKGIIHRDIKPSNILVCIQDGRPLAKVIDFGVAKALHQRLTEATLYTEIGAIIGTLEYMSPEQAEMSPLGVDTRTDVYSLGVVLYELLTGSTPLDRKRLRKAAYSDVVRIIKEEEPPRPSTRLTQSKETLTALAARRGCQPGQLRKELRSELDWIVMKCLEKDRTRRYESVSALAWDLESYLADKPVHACPPSNVYLASKFVRRHRGAVAAAVSTLVLLLAGMVGTTWGLIQAERARGRADAAAAEERKAHEAETEQRQLAEENERRAVAERKVAEAVRTFLQHDLLQQAGAVFQANAALDAGRRGEAKENPTIKEVLDRAAANLTPDKINRKFPDQFEVQGSILVSIGRTYEAIGEYPKALELLTRAHDAYRRAFGADHPETMNALSHLALCYRRLNKPEQAAAGLEQVYAFRARRYGPEDRKTVETLIYLGGVQRSLGDLPRAIAALEQGSAILAKTLGPDHRDAIAARGTLAWLYLHAGRKEESVALFEQVRAAQEKQLGKEHPQTLGTLHNLSFAYKDVGRTTDALALLERVRKGRLKALGATHPETINTLEALAEAYEAAGDLPGALAFYKQAAEAIEKRDFHYGFTGIVFARMSRCLEKLKQFDEAEACRRRLVEETRRKEGPQALEHALALGGLVDTLLVEKKYTEAEPLSRGAWTVLSRRDPNDWRTFAAEVQLGDVLLQQQQYAEAELRLREGYEGLTKQAAHMPKEGKARLAEALDGLVRLYEAQGKHDEAAKWREQRPTQGRPK